MSWQMQPVRKHQLRSSNPARLRLRPTSRRGRACPVPLPRQRQCPARAGTSPAPTGFRRVPGHSVGDGLVPSRASPPLRAARAGPTARAASTRTPPRRESCNNQLIIKKFYRIWPFLLLVSLGHDGTRYEGATGMSHMALSIPSRSVGGIVISSLPGCQTSRLIDLPQSGESG